MNTEKQYQLSLQLYPEYGQVDNKPQPKEYLYSVPYSEKEAKVVVANVLALMTPKGKGYDNKNIVCFEQEKGTLYLRANDIKTILLKPVEVGYGK